MYLKQGGTIQEFVNESFSCYHSQNGHECYECKQCYKKFLEAYYFGYKYDEKTKIKMIDYLKTNVIPKNNFEGTYFTKRKGEGKYMKKAINNLFLEVTLWGLCSL